MEDSNQLINSNIINSLNNLYESNGRDKQAWEDLLISLNKANTYLGVIYFFNQKIINCPAHPITLDIIDFLIDYGPINLIREISKIEFMKNVFNLLRRSSGSSPEIQKKGIYLTKKWNEKANEYPNENFIGFIHNYEELNHMGITLPPPGFKMYTYEQYISLNEANFMKSKAENNSSLINNNYINNNFNNNYNDNIYNNNNFNNNIYNSHNNNYLNNNNYNNYFGNQNSLYNKEQSINSNINSNNINNEKNNEIDNNFSIFQNVDEKENPFNELNNKNIVKFPDNFQHDFSDIKSTEIIDKPNSENNKKNHNNDNFKNIKENKNMGYSIYNNELNNNCGKNNNFIQNNSGTPGGENYINYEQNMGVPPLYNKNNNNENNDLYCAPLISNNSPFQTPLNSKSNNYNTIYNNGFKNNNRFNNNNNDINYNYNYSFNYNNNNNKDENKNYNYNNNNNNKELNKYIKGMEKVGGMMKKGIFNVGKAVKNSTVKGYNFIKNKVENKSKEEEIHNEVWGDYMDKIDSNNNYNQNYSKYNNNNNFYNQGNNFNSQNNNYNNNGY